MAAENKLSYKAAGVDIDAGEQAVRRIKEHARSTHGPQVMAGLGGFGGLYEFPSSDYKHPVLVSSTDGVGTKLKVAFATGRHDTIGQDLVNHCVNDILTTGARPLFFLDYFAAGTLDPATFEEVVRGLAAACRQNDCALVGGETAEMPGFYQTGEYDISGTIVGVVEKEALLPNREIEAGNLLVGLPSSGLHTNGFSLARKALLEKPWLRGCGHITGGGLEGNLNRLLPDGRRLVIDWESWEWPAIFSVIQQAGNVGTADLRRTFNLGIGWVLVIDPAGLAELEAHLATHKEPCTVIGEVQ